MYESKFYKASTSTVTIIIFRRRESWNYTKIDSKYYMIIGIVTGMAVVALEEVISSPITIQKLVADALPGAIATICYETINKKIHL